MGTSSVSRNVRDIALMASIVVVGVAFALMLAGPSTAADLAAFRTSLERERAERLRSHSRMLEDQSRRHREDLARIGKRPGEELLLDPALEIPDWMRLRAGLVVTNAERITVAVERFADFHVTVHLARNPEKPPLRRWTRELVTALGPRLRSLRFVSGEETVARLSAKSLDSRIDFPNLSEAELDRLLAPAPEWAGSSSSDPEDEPGKLPWDQVPNPHARLAIRLNEEMSTNWNARIGELVATTRALAEAGRIRSAGSPQGSLQGPLLSLEALSGSLKALGSAFRATGEEFDKRTREMGMNLVLTHLLERTWKPKWKRSAGAAAEVAESATKAADALRTFLRSLEASPAAWSLDGVGLTLFPGAAGDGLRDRERDFRIALEDVELRWKAVSPPF